MWPRYEENILCLHQCWYPGVGGRVGGWDWVSPDNPSYLWFLTNTAPAYTEHHHLPFLWLLLKYLVMEVRGWVMLLLWSLTLSQCESAWQCETPAQTRSRHQLSGVEWSGGQVRRAQDWLAQSRRHYWWTSGGTKQHFLSEHRSRAHHTRQARLLNISGKLHSGKSLEYSTNWHGKCSTSFAFTYTYLVRFLSKTF